MRKPKLIQLTTVDLSLWALLSYQLHRFAEEGFEVVAASAAGPYVRKTEAAGIRHVPVADLTRRWAPGRDALAFGQLVRMFRREQPDMVHTHNPKSGVLGRVAARTAGVPIILNTVHGLYANPSLSPLRRKAIGMSERAAARLSHHEFFQSEEDYEFALRTRMVPGSRASLLGNGVDLKRFDPAKVTNKAATELRRMWGAKPRTKVVGTVGRLVREKGYEELFEGARIIRTQRKDVLFVVVGPDEPGKEDRVGPGTIERARAEGVVFHGEGMDMPTIYAAFDVFVLASRREGVPRSAIEAAAMERPVVATDIRGCREVVVDGVTGMLVPAGDPREIAAAVMELVEEEDLRQRMGAEGRKRAEASFDEEKVVQRTLAVYRRLLRERGG